MLGNQYGGPSYIGPSTKIILDTQQHLTVELVPFVPGNQKSPFQKTSFSVYASSGNFFLRQGSTASVQANIDNDSTTSFELAEGVYWRIDVDNPNQRFLGIGAGTYPGSGEGETNTGKLMITVISEVNPDAVMSGTA